MRPKLVGAPRAGSVILAGRLSRKVHIGEILRAGRQEALGYVFRASSLWDHRGLDANGSSVPSWWCDLVHVTSTGPHLPCL